MRIQCWQQITDEQLGTEGLPGGVRLRNWLPYRPEARPFHPPGGYRQPGLSFWIDALKFALVMFPLRHDPDRVLVYRYPYVAAACRGSSSTINRLWISLC